MIPTFQKRAAPQNRSRLLSLPTELRLHILHMLLKPPGGFKDVLCKRTIAVNPVARPNGTQSRSHQRKIRVRNCKDPQHDHLQPRLLRACQQLYTEGFGVLYAENQMEMLLELDSGRPWLVWQPCHAEILGDKSTLTQLVLGRSTRYDLFRQCRRLRLKFVMEDPNEHIRVRDIDQDYLEMPTYCQRVVATLRTLRLQLRDKVVEVRFTRNDLPWTPSHEHDCQLMVTIFQLIRCRQITFPDFGHPCIQHVKTKVEGSDDVVDLFTKAYQLHSSIRGYRSSTDLSDDRSWPSFLQNKAIRDAVFALDPDRFADVTRGVLMDAIVGREKFAECEKKRLRQELVDVDHDTKRFKDDIQKKLGESEIPGPATIRKVDDSTTANGFLSDEDRLR